MKRSQHMQSRQESRKLPPVDTGRRRFLRFGGRDVSAAIRPPWTEASTFTDNCTRCGACLAACPEKVLINGDGGFPELAPSEQTSSCIFCGACADACQENVFSLHFEPVIEARVTIMREACLADVGIHCECCRDTCDQAALRFRPRLGGPAVPMLDTDRCTACGACLSVCPNDAIVMQFHPRTKDAA